MLRAELKTTSATNCTLLSCRGGARVGISFVVRWGRPAHESASALRAEMILSGACERMVPHVTAVDGTAFSWNHG